MATTKQRNHQHTVNAQRPTQGRNNLFATNDSIPPLRSMNKVSCGVFMVPRCFSDCSWGASYGPSLCRGGYFHYAAGNGDCGCAISKGCYGRMTFASNWTIYYRHPPAELLVDSGTSLHNMKSGDLNPPVM